MEYCNVLAIKETKNIFLRKPIGIGNHQIKIDAAKKILNPLKALEGNVPLLALLSQSQILKRLEQLMILKYL